jgi:hypothetical protein
VGGRWFGTKLEPLGPHKQDGWRSVLSSAAQDYFTKRAEESLQEFQTIDLSGKWEGVATAQPQIVQHLSFNSSS